MCALSFALAQTITVGLTALGLLLFVWGISLAYRVAREWRRNGGPQ